jgi:hypothetical protein
MPTVPSDEEFRTYNQGVVSEFRANHGSVSQPPFPILLLTTTGARTGRQTTVPLGFGVDDKGRVFVVGSKAPPPTSRTPTGYSQSSSSKAFPPPPDRSPLVRALSANCAERSRRLRCARGPDGAVRYSNGRPRRTP